MGRGREVINIWKDHSADPFFWIALKGRKEPSKVYYGREGWEVREGAQSTGAKSALDLYMKDPATVVASIDIAGPLGEILVLIEHAGYHMCCAYPRPSYIRAPRKLLEEMSGHLATLQLMRALRENDRHGTEKLRNFSEFWPYPSKFNNRYNQRNWSPVSGYYMTNQ